MVGGSTGECDFNAGLTHQSVVADPSSRALFPMGHIAFIPTVLRLSTLRLLSPLEIGDGHSLVEPRKGHLRRRQESDPY